MNKLAAFAAVTFAAATALAFSPTLHNDDSSRYNYVLECGGSSTNSWVDSNSTVTLSSGCTLKVEGAGSADLKDDMSCQIKDGSLRC